MRRFKLLYPIGYIVHPITLHFKIKNFCFHNWNVLDTVVIKYFKMDSKLTKKKALLYTVILSVMIGFVTLWNEEILRHSTYISGALVEHAQSYHSSMVPNPKSSISGTGSDQSENIDIESTPSPETTTKTKTDTKNGNSSTKSSRKLYNVLFLMADDMRPQLGELISGTDHPAFNTPKLFSPNFDKLAQKSVVFQRAYSQYSLCGPSRTSMLTGRRPDTTRIFINHLYWRDTGGNFTTLPQYFRENGYSTYGAGKIFHRGPSSNNSDPMSWSEQFFGSTYTDSFYDPPRLQASGWKAVTAEQRQNIPLTDEIAVNYTLNKLKAIATEAKKTAKPFFFALGFRKPHISFVCPEEYFDHYPLESGQFMAEEQWQSPHVQWQFGVAKEDSNGKRFIPEDILKNLRRAYFACVSYVDHLLGILLDELDTLGLTQSTIVSFIADHGYHLGENDHWGKFQPSELANRIPMMLHIPGKTDEGIVSKSLVEAVDMFPTLAEAAGLQKVPSCPKNSSDILLCTEGVSLLPLIDNPQHSVKDAAISQVFRYERYTLYAIRTDRFRYTEFADLVKEPLPNGKYNIHLDWSPSGFHTELYDHKYDTEERFNKTVDPAYGAIKQELQMMLHDRVTTTYNVPR